MPINGLTINQEKKIRAERREKVVKVVVDPNGVSTSPYHLLALAVAKFRRLQKEAGKSTGGMGGQRERAECIREIDYHLDVLKLS